MVLTLARLTRIESYSRVLMRGARGTRGTLRPRRLSSFRGRVPLDTSPQAPQGPVPATPHPTSTRALLARERAAATC
jgi:hypothetical protein